MAEGDVKVLFMPSGRRGFFPRGTPLLDAARSLGVDIDSDVLDLRGQIVSSGTFPSYEDFVFDQLGATEEEMTLAIAEVELMTGNSLTDADLTGAVIFARLDEALGKVDIRELLPPSFEPAGSDPTVPLLSEGGMVTLVGCFLLTAFVMARARRASGTL